MPPINTRPELAPPDYCDPVIEAYKKDVDRTLLRENLKLTVQQRFDKFKSFVKYAKQLREAGRRARGELQALLEERDKNDTSS